MNLRFRQLQAFHAVYEIGTVTGAAVRLDISQPGISNLISQLEAQTRLKLFVRDKGRLRPTPEAHVFYNAADTAIRGFDQAAQAVDDLRNKASGQLTVACPHHLSFSFMPEIIARFAEGRPDLSISFQSNYSAKIREWVASGLFEIGVCEASALDPSLDAKVFRFEMLCAIPATLDAPVEDALTPTALSALPIIALGRDHVTHQRMAEAFAAAGVELHPKIHTHLFENALALTARGLGATMIDPFSIMHRRYNGFEVRAFRPIITLDLAIVTARGRRISMLAREFLDMMEAEFASFALAPPEGDG
ncbi:MAG: LysR substrate-binding domain-containing protein [Pseudomonadota bacterium]